MIRNSPLAGTQTALGKQIVYVPLAKFCEKLLPNAKFHWGPPPYGLPLEPPLRISAAFAVVVRCSSVCPSACLLRSRIM